MAESDVPPTAEPDVPLAKRARIDDSGTEEAHGRIEYDSSAPDEGSVGVEQSEEVLQATEATGPPRWYAVDLKKKAKIVNLALPNEAVQVLLAEIFKSGGKLSNRQLPTDLPAADPNKVFEARVVTLAEMQTHGPPGWWQVSSQYASPEDAARTVLIQQAKYGDVQGKHPWRLLVRVSEGSALQQILADETSQDWQISELVGVSASLFYTPMEEAQLAKQIAGAAQLAAAKARAAAADLYAQQQAMEFSEQVLDNGELERDAPDDPRARLSEPVEFLIPDTTMNVLPSTHGNLLMTTNEGGLQYLLAGARGSVGIKSGRYMFEAQIIESLNQVEITGSQARTPVPKNLLRIGFSIAHCTPILGDSEESICFDSEGNLLFNRRRNSVAHKFTVDNTVAVVLTLASEDTPNANTMSLFIDGERACEPQHLPEALKGKTLFPTVTFKNMTIHVNFGETPRCPLPFTCRMVQDMSSEDAVVTSYQPPKNGKYEVLFPVMLPDEGTFTWLDWYLKHHPQYTELSERVIVEWALRSGLWRPKTQSYKSSNDRPDMNFGIPHLDDGSVKQILTMVAAVQERDFVVMDVKGNLLAADRAEALKQFQMPHFRKIARVMVGEPTQDYKNYVQQQMLQEKQFKSDAEFEAMKLERTRQRQLEIRQKQIEKARRKAERVKQRLQEAAERKELEGDASEDATEKALEAANLEEEQDDNAEDEKQPMEEDDNEMPPKVELTEQEKCTWFPRIAAQADLSPMVLSQSFPQFKLPDAEEGFDAVEYGWLPREDSDLYLRRWNLERKVTTRVEEIQPSDWFKGRWSEWQKDLQAWHTRHLEFKDPSNPTSVAAVAPKVLQPKPAVLKSKPKAKGIEFKPTEEGQSTEEPSETIDGKPAEGQNGKEQQPPVGSGPTSAKADDDDPIKELEAELERRDFDVFGIESILDVGNGEPLFANFAFEDWALLSLRFELHLLVHAFRRDCFDAERGGMHPDHLAFYYNRYYKKGLNPKNYGVESVEELIHIIRDTVIIVRKVISSHLTDDLETNEVFVKLTEESRRDRQRRLDAGDTSAQLRFRSGPQDHGLLGGASGGKGTVGIRPPGLVTPAPNVPPGVVAVPSAQRTVRLITPNMVPPQQGARSYGAVMRKGQTWYAPRGCYGQVIRSPVMLAAQQRALMARQSAPYPTACPAAWRGYRG